MSTAEWTLYSVRRPSSPGIYEWRMPSRAIPGMVLVVAAHMRERNAGYTREVSPEFDYWDGYKLHVPKEVEWRETSEHAGLRECDTKIVSVEGLALANAFTAGRSRRIALISATNTAA